MIALFTIIADILCAIERQSPSFAVFPAPHLYSFVDFSVYNACPAAGPLANRIKCSSSNAGNEL